MKSTILAILALAAAGRPAAVGRELADFEARLDRGSSATEVLQGWCADHRLADPPVIRAERDRTLDKPADAAVRALLGAGPDEPIRYRRVRLTCGAHVLSEADNWYRPGRLTAGMNRKLDETDTPFGAVVRPLGFHRRTLAEENLFRSDAGGRQALPHILVRYHALLVDSRGVPFSLVTESYTSELLSP
jgi:hypothetical protein